MAFYYSSDRNVQMLVYLLKENGIKKVIASPGTANAAFVASVQQDPFFEVYSAIDERGAAYMACGLSFESGEPVVITCTGATASRNYLPGLTEAFYRKLPILAITGAHDYSSAGNLLPQFIDRSTHPVDAVKYSVHLQKIKDEKDEKDCNLKINRAILELTRNGGGPVHIDITSNNTPFDVQELPPTRVIRRYTLASKLPQISVNGKIAISVGAHKPMSQELTTLIDKFCATYNAVVFVDHSSNYKGAYKFLPTIVSSQEKYKSHIFDIDLLIHIGEHSGDYYTFFKLPKAKEVWRVSEDGEVRDTFGKLTKIFDMREEDFFKHYATEGNAEKSYLEECRKEAAHTYNKIPELPLSNIWIAKTITQRLPKNSAVHIGVSNTMRAWTFFELPDTVLSVANVGVRGIDGAISSALGMSLADRNRIHYCVLGDLTFFYNINALGNRQVGSNLRILLINNGKGTEFCLYPHIGRRYMNSEVEKFVAAGGHNGNKSDTLVKHFSEDLGFTYLSASTKEEALKALDVFLDEKMSEKPILFEVFTDSEDENEALKLLRNIREDTTGFLKGKMKEVLGEKGISKVKNLLKK